MLDRPCPECQENPAPEDRGRRSFLRTLGAATVLAAGPLATSAPAPVRAAEAKAKPAEDLVKELYGTLSADQKKELVLPWDHGSEGNATPTRLRMVNSPHQGKKIGEVYTPAQQELNERILKAIADGEEGYRRISRNGKFDGSGSLAGCGALIFGEPTDGQKFSWVFTGHHLTVRCDGNSEPGAAFGGPMYYGHSAVGYSENNVFNYQTKAVQSVFEALTAEQRKQAIANGTPGEHAESIKFRQEHPGIAAKDLTPDQVKLVEGVMREVLAPYRREDADEVMSIVKGNGGLAKLHLAFYRDQKMADSERWHFWRLEGPGFVWNYRVLPHVHCYVHIASQTA